MQKKTIIAAGGWFACGPPNAQGQYGGRTSRRPSHSGGAWAGAMASYTGTEIFPDLGTLAAAADLVVRAKALGSDRIEITETVEPAAASREREDQGGGRWTGKGGN